MRSLLLLAFFAGITGAVAQNNPPVGKTEQPAPALNRPRADSASSGRLPRFGLGVKISTLGAGIEAGTALTQRSNLRVGFNAISYSHTFEDSGFDYAGELALRSVEAHYDWYAFGGGFRISPGILFLLKNPATATATVHPGERFTLNDVDYVSDPNNPIRGSGEFKWNRVAPTFTVGWGNLLRRTGRHWSVPFEIGVAVMGTPTVAFDLRGGVCQANGSNCRNASNYEAFQTNLNDERRKINNDVSAFKVYPILSTGFAYRF